MHPKGRYSEAEALELALPLASALEVIGQAGLVHRDVKPDNIMFTKSGRVKLCDLGLARLNDEDSSLTKTNATIGTPLYMAPEQARGNKDVDARADIYALGATLYHLLTGKPPFTGESSAAILTAHVTSEATHPQALAPDISNDMVRVLRKMLAKDPSRRYHDAGELHEDLEALKAGLPPQNAGGFLGKSSIPLRDASRVHAHDTHRPRRKSTQSLKPITRKKNTAQQRPITSRDLPADDFADSDTPIPLWIKKPVLYFTAAVLLLIGFCLVVLGRRSSNEPTKRTARDPHTRPNPRGSTEKPDPGKTLQGNQGFAKKPDLPPGHERRVQTAFDRMRSTYSSLSTKEEKKKLLREFLREYGNTIVAARVRAWMHALNRQKREQTKRSKVQQIPWPPIRPKPEPSQNKTNDNESSIAKEKPSVTDHQKALQEGIARKVSDEWGKYQIAFWDALRARDGPRAQQLFNRALQNPDLPSFGKQIAQDRIAIGWLKDLHESFQKGVAKLNDVDEQVLHLTNGNTVRVGCGSEFKVRPKIKNDTIFLFNGGMEVPMPLKRLSPKSIEEITALGLGSDAPALVRRAFMTLLRENIDKSKSKSKNSKTVAEARYLLKNAKRAGAKPEEVSYLTRCIKRGEYSERETSLAQEKKKANSTQKLSRSVAGVPIVAKESKVRLGYHDKNYQIIKLQLLPGIRPGEYNLFIDPLGTTGKTLALRRKGRTLAAAKLDWRQTISKTVPCILKLGNFLIIGIGKYGPGTMNLADAGQLLKGESLLIKFRQSQQLRTSPESRHSSVLAHFKFNGNAKDLSGNRTEIELKNTKFIRNALYLNGRYDLDNKAEGYVSKIHTPSLNYDSFCVAIRFRADDFEGSHRNVLTGGRSFRWFGLRRSQAGRLECTLNNQALTYECKKVSLKKGHWYVVTCGVDVPKRRLFVFVNGRPALAIKLPDEFSFPVKLSYATISDKQWLFTNYSNASVFKGLVDELIVIDGMLPYAQLRRLIFVEFNHGPAQVPKDVPRMTLAAPAAPPLIDGNLRDPCWARVAPVPLRFMDGRNARPTAKSEVRMMATKKYLYVAARFDEPEMERIVMPNRARDEHVWADDCIELFMIPGLDPTAPKYQWVVNIAGNIWDGKGAGRMSDPKAWDAEDVKFKIFKRDNYWSIEIALPLDSMPGSKDHKLWRFNVTRNRPARKGAGRETEYTSWCNLKTNAPHTPERFGVLAIQALDDQTFSLDPTPPANASEQIVCQMSPSKNLPDWRITYYRPSSTRLRDKPPEKRWLEPPRPGVLRLYAQFSLAHKTKIRAVLDLLADGEAYVFFDTNNDRNFQGETRYRTIDHRIPGPVSFDIEYADGLRQSYPLQVYFFNITQKESPNRGYNLAYYRASVKEGRIRLGEKDYLLAISDDNADGLYSDLDHTEILLGVSQGGKPIDIQRFGASSSFRLNKTYYRASAITPDGSRLTLAPSGIGTLLGTVASAQDGRPVAGATVTVFPHKFTTQTKIDGSFLLKIPEGIYWQVLATANGFVPKFQRARFRIRAGKNVRIDLGLTAPSTQRQGKVRLAKGDSYHFLAGQRHQYSGGDFYLGFSKNKAKFFANNAHQKGIVDLGNIGNVPLNTIGPKTQQRNYSRFGVEAIVGHTYLSPAKGGEEGHYIIFRVIDLKPNESIEIKYQYR